MQARPPNENPEGGGRALRNVALLTLPLLAAQRDMLGICKNALKDDGCILPMQNFALRQFYAVMMVFDPSRKFRDAWSGLEESFGKTCQETAPKVISSSVALIEAQEAMLSSVIDTLTKMKNAPDKAKGNGGS